jgi:hypothetical protein
MVLRVDLGANSKIKRKDDGSFQGVTQAKAKVKSASPAASKVKEDVHDSFLTSEPYIYIYICIEGCYAFQQSQEEKAAVQ